MWVWISPLARTRACASSANWRASVARRLPQNGLRSGQRALKVTLGERLMGPNELTLNVHPGVSRHLADELPEVDRRAGGDRLLETMGWREPRVHLSDRSKDRARFLHYGPHGGGARPPQRP